MKILNRPQLQAEIAKQRREQIDEGMRIAQRVDGLRQTLVSLEAQYAEISAQIAKDTNDKLLIINELEERRKELEAKIQTYEHDGTTDNCHKCSNDTIDSDSASV